MQLTISYSLGNSRRKYNAFRWFEQGISYKISSMFWLPSQHSTGAGMCLQYYDLNIKLRISNTTRNQRTYMGSSFDFISWNYRSVKIKTKKTKSAADTHHPTGSARKFIDHSKLLDRREENWMISLIIYDNWFTVWIQIVNCEYKS